MLVVAASLYLRWRRRRGETLSKRGSRPRASRRSAPDHWSRKTSQLKGPASFDSTLVAFDLRVALSCRLVADLPVRQMCSYFGYASLQEAQRSIAGLLQRDAGVLDHACPTLALTLDEVSEMRGRIAAGHAAQISQA